MRSRQEFGMDSAKILQSPNNHPTITQQSPNNHPRITQVCQGIFSVGFFAQCEGDVGLAWEYRSGWCKKVSIGEDGVKREYGSGWYKKKDCLTSLSNSLPLCCGGWDRTTDLQVMSLTSCHCSTPRYKYLRPCLFTTLPIISALSTLRSVIRFLALF